MNFSEENANPETLFLTRNLSENNEEKVSQKNFADDDLDKKTKISSHATDIPEPKLYQLLMFIITQMGYTVIAGSMLSVAYFEPSSVHSFKSNNSNINFNAFNNDFYSLLLQWNIPCESSDFTVLASSCLMAGAMLGSFVVGYLADLVGRKYAVEGSMLLICLSNLFMSFFADFSWIIAAFIYFLLGMACGGYIVTNLVLLIESIDSSQNRLLAISLNGFPVGMIFTALLGYFTKHWKLYHLILSVISSWRWLLDHQKRDLALKIRTKIVRKYSNNFNENFIKKLEDNLDYKLYLLINEYQTTIAFTYRDLFQNPEIRTSLLVMFLCFFTSSVVSFGLFFLADVLPGDRYVNLTGMGVGKLLFGVVPYLISFWVGRRTVMMVSVAVAGLACWGLVFVWIFFKDSANLVITLLGLIITAATDPTWKINHLYSMELFPIRIRNMARGLCQVMARIGSLAGPLIIYLRTKNPLIPFYIFGGLLICQFVVCYFLLPETKNRKLSKQLTQLQKR